MTRRASVLLLFAALCVGGCYVYVHRAAPYTDVGLAAYVTTERLDPIFAIEGTDPHKLASAVDEFLAMRDRIAAQYQGAERETIESLYPAVFLTLLPKLEAARQAMLVAPSFNTAQAYHALLAQTIEAYASDAKRTARLVRDTDSAYPMFEYAAGAAKPAAIAAVIESVDTSAQAQLAKENQRYACLSRPTACAPVAPLLADRANRIGLPASLAKPPAYVRTVAALTESLNRSYPSYMRTEPIVLAFESTCVPSSTIAYAQAYYLSNRHGLGRKLSFVHDAYFYDIAALKTDFPTRSEYGSLLEAGVRWQFQNFGNLYECPDSGYDQAAASSLLGTLDALRAHATSSEVRHILSLATLSKADLAPYVTHMAATDTLEANDLVERYLEGSSDFDQVILGALNDNGFLLASTTSATGKRTVPVVSFIVLTRNFASTMFMMGNPTFVGQPQSLFATHTPPGLKNFHLRSYVSELSKMTPASGLVTQFQKSLRVEYPATP